MAIDVALSRVTDEPDVRLDVPGVDVGFGRGGGGGSGGGNRGGPSGRRVRVRGRRARLLGRSTSRGDLLPGGDEVTLDLLSLSLRLGAGETLVGDPVGANAGFQSPRQRPTAHVVLALACSS